MITLQYRDLSVAQKVMKEFEKILKKNHPESNETGWIDVMQYANGRENGFHLIEWAHKPGPRRRAVSFSEYRSSDDIVVYCGMQDEFERGTGVPSDDIYRAARFFNFRDHKGAAQEIYNHLMG